jgi:hypothetical protein
MLPPTLGVSESLPSVAFDLNGLNTDGSIFHELTLRLGPGFFWGWSSTLVSVDRFRVEGPT